MTNVMWAWDKIIGQERVRAHDCVSQIFRADKNMSRDLFQAAPSDYYDYINGQTGFMREAKFYKSLIQYLDSLEQDNIDVLIVAGSVGCEAYSAAVLKDMMGIQKNIRFHTSDISKSYIDVAKAAAYPEEWVLGHGDRLASYFNHHADSNCCIVHDDIRKSVIVRDAEDVRDVDCSEQFDVVIGMNFLMHVVTSPIHFYGMEKFDSMILDEVRNNGVSRRDARRKLDIPFLEHIDPILSNMCALSRHLVCVNRLEDTPYFHSNRKARVDIFADNGFDKTMDERWIVQPSTDLENNSVAGDYSRKRDYTQVLVRG